MEERSPEFRKLLDVIDNLQFDLYKMWNDPANANIRKLIAQEYLDSFREYNKINGFQNNDVEDIKRVGKMLPGAEKYLPRSGVLGTVRDKLSDAARVAGQATAILRGGIAAGMSLPVLAAALVGLGIGKVVAENMAADALKAQNPATLRVRPGSANEPAYSLLQDTAMGLLPASVTNTLPGVPAGFDSRKAPPPEGLPIDTSGLLAPAAVPAAAAEPEPEPEPDVPPPPSDNQLSGYNVPAGLPGGNLATKIRNVSYTAIPNAAEMMITINYEDGSSKPVRPNNPELRAYEDALPNRGPGISDSVSSALSGFGSAVAGALTPSTVVVGPDGKVRLPAPESPKNPLVAQALASPGVPPAMSDTDMYGAPAPGATDTQLAGAKSARDATGAAWNQPITPADRERVQANAEKQFVQLMESRWTEGLSTLNAMGLRAQSDALSLARNGMIGRRNSALANLNSLRPALLIATQALTRQAPTSAVAGSAEYQLWMQQQSPQVMSQFLAANEAHAKAQVAYDAATEAYIASTLAPELLANKPGEWSNIREAIDPSGSGQKVLMGLYTDGSGRQSFRIIGWDDSVGALTQAPAPDPADPNAGKRGGGEIAPTIIPGQGAALPGAAQAAGATPRPAVPPAAPGGAPGTGGTRPIVVSGSAAAAAPRPRAYESVNDRTTGFRSTYNDDGVLVGSTKIPGWDVRQTYTHTTRMRDDGSMVDLVMDTLGNVIEERVLTSPDPLKVQAAEQARQNAETQRVVQSNTNLGNQYTLARQAAIDTQGRNDTEYKDARTDLEGKIKASTEERKRKVLDLVAQKKLTLPQALSILHDQQGLATAMSAEQQRWEQQRGQRMAEKDKGLTYAQSLDKDLGIGGALLSLRSDPQAEDIKRRYAAEIPTLPGRPEDSVGVRLAQQRGYSGVAYQDPGAWQQPDLTMTPEALSGMGVGEDPTDAFYAQYQALQRRAPVAAPAPPVFQPLPTFGQPAAPVAQMPAAVGGWGAGLGRLGQ